MTIPGRSIEDDFETIRKVFRFEADPLIVGNEALERIERAYVELRDDRDGKGFLRDCAEAKLMRLERELEAATSALERIATWSQRAGLDPSYQTPNGLHHERIARVALDTSPEDSPSPEGTT